MANFLDMIPFILYSEVGLEKKHLTLPLEQMYEKARAKGVTTLKGDKGGATMCGLTIGTYQNFKGRVVTEKELSQVPFEEWKQILKKMFWDKWQADLIKTPQIAYAVVDWLWTSGRYGITNVQRVLGVKADGIVGPKTLAAINGHKNQRELFDKIQAARHDYFTRISMPGSSNAVFRQGWYNRLKKITWDGFRY